jgi:hypothetical protein
MYECTFIQNQYCMVHSATAADVHMVHIYTPYVTPNTKHKICTGAKVIIYNWYLNVLTAASVKMWPHVIWHMEYQNSVIHLPMYGVTSHNTDYLWVLRFLGWHDFRFWLSVMWCCITGWGAPERNTFLQNIGSLGSPNGMESHPRRIEYLRNVIFMYKLSVH